MARQDFSTYSVLPYAVLFTLCLLRLKSPLTAPCERASNTSKSLGRSGGLSRIGREKGKSLSLESLVTLCSL